MTINVCIFSDGTGQAGQPGARDNTHVYRLYRACSFVPGDPRFDEQACYYDPGLGSSGDGPGSAFRRGPVYRILSKATGLGITANIKDCYDNLIRMYRPGSRIFLIGFSRGAYTVRSLGGVIGLCGVPMLDEKKRVLAFDADARRAVVERAVEEVYKIYAKADTPTARQAAADKRREKAAAFRKDYAVDAVHPYFIGAWDTVRALGLPGSTGVSRLFSHAFHDAKLGAGVSYARQVLAIDERRVAFEPVPWTRGPVEAVDPPRISQVWFAGGHSDAGGGYAAGALADHALGWMVQEAVSLPHPLLVGPIDPVPRPDHLGNHHDEADGFTLWRTGLREIPADIPLHGTVGERFGRMVVHHRPPPRPYRPENLRGHPGAGGFPW